MVPTENGVSTQNVIYKSEIQEENESQQLTDTKTTLMDYIPIYIPTIEKGLIDQKHHKKRFLDFLKAHPTNDWFLKSGFVRRFRQNARSSDDSMSSDPIQEPGRRRFRVPFIRKINWKALLNYFKKWIRSPHNIALFIWLLFVAAGLILMGLLMFGILNGAIPSDDRRKKWEEITNQILNALFQIMCLYEHPRIFHHTVLLIRWRPNDQVEARSAYCKNGTPRPHDRAHMIFVVILLHVTCFAQYAYCGLFWGYSRETRPDWAENLCIGVGIGAPVVAALYTFFGPLAKKVETTTDQESQAHAAEVALQQEESKMQLYHRKIIVTRPEWIGGLFDCWDDVTVALTSFFCTFCVFGWNMERIGFGNMYVHIVTFLLLCVSPLWVFYVAALNINNETIRLIVAISGAVLCVFGLLYGGYWRSKMRQKFKLPGNPFCCGYPLVTDCVQWFFCWCCSLAQEVRTANFYDIEDDGFYRKVTDEEGHSVLVPLPREGNLSFSDTPRSYSCPPKIGPTDAANSKEGSMGCSPLESPMVFGRSSTFSKVHAMTPPVPPLIQMEDEHPMKE